MEEQKKTVVTFDGLEHVYDDLNDEQKRLVTHLIDLANKIEVEKRSLEQHQVSHEAFIQSLRKTFVVEAEVVEESEVKH
jgi:hypothetical protein